MITGAITREQIKKWKQLYEEVHDTLTPNRKSGVEVDAFFRERYPYTILHDSKFQEVVTS